MSPFLSKYDFLFLYKNMYVYHSLPLYIFFQCKVFIRCCLSSQNYLNVIHFNMLKAFCNVIKKCQFHIFNYQKHVETKITEKMNLKVTGIENRYKVMYICCCIISITLKNSEIEKEK